MSAISEPCNGDLTILNARLPYLEYMQATSLWDIQVRGGRIQTILPAASIVIENHMQGEEGRSQSTTYQPYILDAREALVLPSFCHSHIHIDKCFILDRCGPLHRGDFAEAMRVTKSAKEKFPNDLNDLYSRGARMIRESVEHGVTTMRVHVEVDTSVGHVCLETALRLRKDFIAMCDIQIAVFAQEPLFLPEAEHPGQNYDLLRQAATQDGVEVIGSAPYVEPSVEQAKKNISLIFDIAKSQLLHHVDFHLDYNLDASSEPLVYEVVSQARMRYKRGSNPSSSTASSSEQCEHIQCPRITIGHATRLQLFSPVEWANLVDLIGDLPITLISLPQSDMFMQGRSWEDEPLGAPRGTLRVPQIAREYGIQTAMSVNNVQNAFTPQGSLDPLSLCTFGVAVFQAIIPEDLQTLMRSVTLTSKFAIGRLERRQARVLELIPQAGDPADLVLLHGPQSTVQSVILCPPYDRTTIKGGKVVSKREGKTWFST